MAEITNADLLSKIARVRKLERSGDILDICGELQRVVEARVQSATAADQQAHIRALWAR